VSVSVPQALTSSVSESSRHCLSLLEKHVPSLLAQQASDPTANFSLAELVEWENRPSDRSPTATQLRKALADWKSGTSWSEISRQLGMDRHTIMAPLKAEIKAWKAVLARRKPRGVLRPREPKISP